MKKGNQMRRVGTTLVSIMVLMFTLGSVVFATGMEFPYRKDFPQVSTIETQALFTGYEAGDIIIVDVRSKIEYEVIHPTGAVHIPISNKNFVKNVQALMADNPGKKVAVYCNGVTCLKSYKAAQKLQNAGISNCFAYDSGIPAWASTYPKNTQLLGKTLVDPEKQLIPKSEFKQKCLPIDAFKEELGVKSGLAIDVRDHIQRSAKIAGLEKSKAIPLDKFIPNFVSKKAHQDKPLFIFDQVGKQVRWLEYYLVENGYNEYYFLAGGATSVLKDQKYKN
jgi:rhodanese-related sulfurtransferase